MPGFCRMTPFLSTLSLRRATAQTARNTSIAGHFYPRSPCGERLLLLRKITITVDISIHALLAESDGGSGVGSWPRAIFLSTLSLRRATQHQANLRQNQRQFLSTLSLRRATALALCFCGGAFDFYPRSPCGERHLTERRH